MPILSNKIVNIGDYKVNVYILWDSRTLEGLHAMDKGLTKIQ